MKKKVFKLTLILTIAGLLLCSFQVNNVLATNGFEGCTPGYWKQSQHLDSWAPTGVSPAQLFSDLFGVSDPDITVLETLAAQGGGAKALLRHAAAAFLNASHPDVLYPLTPDEVINLVQVAFASGDFEVLKMLLSNFNEMGCPLD